MIYRTHFDSAGILLLVTVLICTTTTAVQPLTTDSTAYNDATSSTTHYNSVDSIIPNETGIPEQSATYAGSEFFEQETTTSALIVPDTEETSQSWSTASVSTLNTIYNTPDHFENTTTSYTNGATSQASPFNTTLSTEAEDNLTNQAASLEIAVIALGIIAGLSIVCIIILVICLIIQKRKQKTLLTKSLMEISKHERQLPQDKCPAVTITSPNDGIDSGSRVSSLEAGLYTPAESTEIYIESDSNVGDRGSNPIDNVYSNENDTYVNFNHNNNDDVNPMSQNNLHVNRRSHNNSYANLRSLNNECVNLRSQNNVYSNERSENNEQVSDSSQNDEIYNNIRDGMNQKHIHPQERRI